MKVSYHENMLKSGCSDMIYCASINYFICSMHSDNQIVIFNVFSKNVNEIEKLTYKNERQIY